VSTRAKPPAVITASPSAQYGGLVLSWRVTTAGPALLSASRDHVMVHGTVDLATIEPWLDDARRAHEALKAGRPEEAATLATHEYHGCDRGFTLIDRSKP
jgi:hypothetical protein